RRRGGRWSSQTKSLRCAAGRFGPKSKVQSPKSTCRRTKSLRQVQPRGLQIPTLDRIRRFPSQKRSRENRSEKAKSKLEQEDASTLCDVRGCSRAGGGIVLRTRCREFRLSFRDASR